MNRLSINKSTLYSQENYTEVNFGRKAVILRFYWIKSVIFTLSLVTNKNYIQRRN
jgi:hypothetical protein